MSTQRTLLGLIVAAQLVALAFLACNVLRLSFVFNTMHSFLLLNVVVLSGICAVGLTQWRRLSIKPLELAIFASLALTTIMADYSDREVSDIIVDIIRPLLFIGVAITLRGLLDIDHLQNAPLLRGFLLSYVGVTIFEVVLCHFISTTYQPLYPAYATIDSILGLAFLIAQPGTAPALIFALLLFYSGKRGVYLAAFVLLAFVFRRAPKKLCWLALTALFAVSTSMVLSKDGISYLAKAPTLDALEIAQSRQVPAVNANEGTHKHQKSSKSAAQHEEEASAHASHSATDESAERLFLIEKFLDIASGGRFDEIRDATHAMHWPKNYIFGQGPGFTYYSKAFEMLGERHRNLHFTPIGLIVYYGLVFTVLFAIYLWTPFCTALKLVGQKDASGSVFVFAAYFLASMLFCLTEYSLFTYANVAISFGILMAYARSKQTVSLMPKP